MGAWRRTRPSRRPWSAAARRAADAAETGLAEARSVGRQGVTSHDTDHDPWKDDHGDLVNDDA